MPFLSPRLVFLQLSFRQLSAISTTTSNRRILTNAQEARTDYLHTTRSLPFVYAEKIARNSLHFLSGIISRIDFSETSDFSVVGFLKNLGMSDRELRSITQMYPYVLGRNKIANLPHVMRALDLHNWLFDQLKKGRCKLLCNYATKDPNEDFDEFYKDGLEICSSRLLAHTITKLKFIHGVGFGENDLTMKLLPSLHGTGSDLQDRFDCFIELGADFSEICRIINRTPKILNQKPDVIIEKTSAYGRPLSKS